jgi:hypothetical protein
MELKVNTAIVSLKYIDAVLTLIMKEKSDKAAQWTERKLERSGLF